MIGRENVPVREYVQWIITASLITYVIIKTILAGSEIADLKGRIKLSMDIIFPYSYFLQVRFISKQIIDKFKEKSYNKG